MVTDVAIVSASTNSRSEDIGIEPIVISKLKLRDLQWHIFGADLVEASDNAAFEDRPETLNRIGMNGTKNVLLFVVIDRLMIVFGQPVIDFAFIGCEQAYSIGNHFADESSGGFASDVRENSGNNITLAAYSADNRRLGRGAMLARTALAVPMLVLVLPADEGLVNLDDTAQLIHVLFDQGCSDFMAHKPSGFDRAEAHIAANLPRTHTLFAGQQEVGDLEPVAERLVGVLEDGPDDN
jgi:hypothetical protein